MARQLNLVGLAPFPLVEPGDNLAKIIVALLSSRDYEFQDGDAIVIAQKVVSKVENRYVRLRDIEPSENAEKLARVVEKDARFVEMVLRESRVVLRAKPGLLIVEHRNGYIHANAGIDQSNIPGHDDTVLLLPQDSDASARALRNDLEELLGFAPHVVINDSFGRPWRNGTVGVALGVAGLDPLYDQIGEEDLFGRKLRATVTAVADELAAAASLVMGQAAEGCPVVIVTGFSFKSGISGANALLRDRATDLFR